MMSDNQSKSAADKIAERSSLLEEQIKENQRRKEQRQFVEELSKRISIAREGRVAIEKNDTKGAIQLLRRFLSITARSMDVDIPNMSPEKIEASTRTAECLLISSILFDLIKVMSTIDTAEAKEERLLYHRLFIRFTLGQPFQAYSAENLRKYVVYRRNIKYKSEFWATYHAVRIKRFCFVATWAFGADDCAPVLRLQHFRDQALGPYALGRAFIEVYYWMGPTLTRGLDLVPGSKTACRFLLARIAARLPNPKN